MTDYQDKEIIEIESEDNNNEDVIGPFDPNDIDVDISVVNLGFLLEQLEYNEIDLQPEFQRTGTSDRHRRRLPKKVV